MAGLFRQKNRAMLKIAGSRTVSNKPNCSERARTTSGGNLPAPSHNAGRSQIIGKNIDSSQRRAMAVPAFRCGSRPSKPAIP
jgi:hypothetical protein